MKSLDISFKTLCVASALLIVAMCGSVTIKIELSKESDKSVMARIVCAPTEDQGTEAANSLKILHYKYQTLLDWEDSTVVEVAPDNDANSGKYGVIEGTSNLVFREQVLLLGAQGIISRKEIGQSEKSQEVSRITKTNWKKGCFAKVGFQSETKLLDCVELTINSSEKPEPIMIFPTLTKVDKSKEHGTDIQITVNYVILKQESNLFALAVACSVDESGEDRLEFLQAIADKPETRLQYSKSYETNHTTLVALFASDDGSDVCQKETHLVEFKQQEMPTTSGELTFNNDEWPVLKAFSEISFSDKIQYFKYDNINDICLKDQGGESRASDVKNFVVFFGKVNGNGDISKTDSPVSCSEGQHKEIFDSQSNYIEVFQLVKESRLVMV
jgi:hypothetical protein